MHTATLLAKYPMKSIGSFDLLVGFKLKIDLDIYVLFINLF